MNERDLRSGFVDFAAWGEGPSPLYARLAEFIARDERLLDLAARVTDGELDVRQLGGFEAHGRWLRWAPVG